MISRQITVNLFNSSKLLTKDYGKNGIEITNALGAYKDNKLQGYVIQVTDKDGFGGEIELIIELI